MGDEILHAEAGLTGDLAEQERGQIARSVDGDGGSPSVRVAEPLVGAALADLTEAELGEDRDDLARPQRRSAGHRG